MGTLLNRRRYMGGVKGEIPASSYIQDGLILQLDGLEDGGTSGHWIDLVNNNDFSLFNATKSDYGYIFANGGVATDGNTPSVPSEYSIEFVLKTYQQSGMSIFLHCPNSDHCFIRLSGSNYSTPSIFHRVKSYGANSYPMNKSTLGSFHISPSLGMQNGNVLTASTSTFGYAQGSTWNILGNYAGTFYVCALRIYNRELTQAEALFNQDLDKKRFDL